MSKLVEYARRTMSVLALVVVFNMLFGLVSPALTTQVANAAERTAQVTQQSDEIQLIVLQDDGTNKSKLGLVDIDGTAHARIIDSFGAVDAEGIKYSDCTGKLYYTTSFDEVRGPSYLNELTINRKGDGSYSISTRELLKLVDAGDAVSLDAEGCILKVWIEPIGLYHVDLSQANPSPVLVVANDFRPGFEGMASGAFVTGKKIYPEPVKENPIFSELPAAGEAADRLPNGQLIVGMNDYTKLVVMEPGDKAIQRQIEMGPEFYDVESITWIPTLTPPEPTAVLTFDCTKAIFVVSNAPEGLETQEALLRIDGAQASTMSLVSRNGNTITWEKAYTKLPNGDHAGTAQVGQITDDYSVNDLQCLEVPHPQTVTLHGQCVSKTQPNDATLSGIVLDQFGKPIANQVVTLTGVMENPVVTTNANGEFTFVYVGAYDHLGDKIIAQAASAKSAELALTDAVFAACKTEQLQSSCVFLNSQLAGPMSVRVTGSYTDPSGTLKVVYVDLGDGTTQDVNSFNFSFEHPYAEAGDYLVQLVMVPNVGQASYPETCRVEVHIAQQAIPGSGRGGAACLQGVVTGNIIASNGTTSLTFVATDKKGHSAVEKGSVTAANTTEQMKKVTLNGKFEGDTIVSFGGEFVRNGDGAKFPVQGSVTRDCGGGKNEVHSKPEFYNYAECADLPADESRQWPASKGWVKHVGFSDMTNSTSTNVITAAVTVDNVNYNQFGADTFDIGLDPRVYDLGLQDKAFWNVAWTNAAGYHSRIVDRGFPAFDPNSKESWKNWPLKNEKGGIVYYSGGDSEQAKDNDAEYQRVWDWQNWKCGQTNTTTKTDDHNPPGGGEEPKCTLEYAREEIPGTVSYSMWASDPRFTKWALFRLANGGEKDIMWGDTHHAVGNQAFEQKNFVYEGRFFDGTSWLTSPECRFTISEPTSAADGNPEYEGPRVGTFAREVGNGLPTQDRKIFTMAGTNVKSAAMPQTGCLWMPELRSMFCHYGQGDGEKFDPQPNQNVRFDFDGDASRYSTLQDVGTVDWHNALTAAPQGYIYVIKCQYDFEHHRFTGEFHIYLAAVAF